MTAILHKFPEIPHQCATIVDILRYRSLKTPHKQAFTFLEDGETQESTLTYYELDRRSRAIATQLQTEGLSGQRALLLYPPGLDYLSAFFGCLYAGVVAVPAYPPRNERKTDRILAISTNAQARVALTTTAILPTLQSILTQQTNIENFCWIVTDNLTQGLEDSWRQPEINADTLAFLQYTSGSTGTPKGVMLSHGNLLHNAAVTYQIMEHSPGSKFVSWLPVYHDMGLIGGILQPLYGGFGCILMSPPSFLQRPYRWLQAISRYKGTTSGGPNFAYEHCIQKITQQQKETLDLSSWSVAFNGAEPIWQETLERFARAFGECGFRPEAFYPCYGMAEATLMVSGGIQKALPDVKTVEKFALSQNRIVSASAESKDTQTFVSCGQTIPQQQIVIVNAETLTRCSPDEIGEIWVSGPSVGQGYWDSPDLTEQTFHASLKDTGVGAFLRTGDLGFLHNGELYITGRAKDLIIIRGRNLYPQDIELTAERSHSSLRSGSGAAFSIEIENEERLVVVQELEFRAKPNLEEVIAGIRQAVTEEHEVQVYAVVLVKPGTISKTSSGKIQRRATKADFQAGKLEVVGNSIQKSIDIDGNGNKLQRETLLALTPRECQPLLESYVQEQIAQVLSIPVHEINPKQPLSSLGLDSIKVFELKNRIENDLEVTVPVADFFEGIHITQLATKILAELTTAACMPSVSLTQMPKAAKFYPLSFAQQRLWFLDRLQPGNPFYNISIVVHLKDVLNVTVLEQSFNEIVRRHQALRTAFTTVERKPMQVICPDLRLTLPVVDLRNIPEIHRVAEVQWLATQEARQPFDLTQGLLLRVTLIQCTEQEYIMLLTMHHIVSDGWSMGVLFRELTVLYQVYSNGQPSPLPELPIQYAHYTIWQRQWLQGEVLESQLTYWKKQLDNLPILQLPTDHPRPAVQTFQGRRQSVVLSESLTDALKVLSQQQEVTLFMTLLATFQMLLHWYTDQEEIVVGTDIANRNQAKTEPLIGFFVNQLVLRINLSENLTFDELLKRVRKITIGAYAHQEVPFDKLVEVLNPQRTLDRTPLFQVKLVLQNVAMPPLAVPGLAVSVSEVDSQTAKYDLLLNLTETEQGLMGWMEYSTDLFEADTITHLLSNFQTLLRTVVVQPEIRLNLLKEILLEADTEKQIAKERELKQTSFQKFKTVKRKAIEEEVALEKT
ncbi:MAG: condensation domain-containing protein [Rhizonema sp. PD38]|nr:condensation domain-containing protein [Rhizonema sp. PD38]